MTVREWWVWHGRNWDVDNDDVLHDLGPVSELWAVEISQAEGRVLRAFGPVVRWRGRKGPPISLLAWEQMRIPMPRRFDSHGRRMPGTDRTATVAELLTSRAEVTETLERRREEFDSRPVAPLPES